MAEFRYKAYISYSHKDEAWASWLHRALESYRVPRYLVGSKTRWGEVPARIGLVFRDRDDLSSATDLGSTVQQALQDSENLIVVCSPHAAASRWVKEEILQFARLGRAERIFCIIVGGEPAEDGSVARCFSSALEEIGLQEPLAADVRAWADGKRVARLKLIAGLLGIRLDELRQRDLQRRRKRYAMVGLGLVAALAMTVMTVVSQISERQERHKAEQLATSIVDLGEKVQSEANLETRAAISALASRHFESLDLEKLSPQTAEKVALVIRQMGMVNQAQGNAEEALKDFQRSRDLLSMLVDKYPEMTELLFQLGNAEFYIGDLHNNQGRYTQALEALQNYHRVARALYDTEPGNADWILELSSSHSNLAAVRLDNGLDFDLETQANLEEAVRLMEKVVAMRPGDRAVAGAYATTLAWAASALAQACNLEEAMIMKDRVRTLAESTSRASPGNNDFKLSYAYAVTGVARVQIAVGRVELAEQNLKLAISILQQLSAADPSNVLYREQALNRQVWLAKLLGETDRLEAAKIMMEEIEPQLESFGVFSEQAEDYRVFYTEFKLAFADVEYQLGNKESADRRLQAVINLQLSQSSPLTNDMTDTQMRVMARYQWWLLNRTDQFDHFPAIPELGGSSAGEFRSCVEADVAARMFVIRGERDNAAREVTYLQSKGYADPNFVRFCTQQSLCGSPLASE